MGRESKSQAWWYAPSIPELGRQADESQSSRLALATKWVKGQLGLRESLWTAWEPIVKMKEQTTDTEKYQKKQGKGKTMQTEMEVVLLHFGNMRPFLPILCLSHRPCASLNQLSPGSIQTKSLVWVSASFSLWGMLAQQDFFESWLAIAFQP